MGEISTATPQSIESHKVTTSPKAKMAKRKLEDDNIPKENKKPKKLEDEPINPPTPDFKLPPKPVGRPVKTNRVTKGRSKKAKTILNHAPTQKLEIFVVGCNEAGELGLGRASEDGNESALLPNETLTQAGVVHVSVDGMHSAALTHDNKILTWGVNDLYALGRDTKWSGGLKDVGNGDDSDTESEPELNPCECVPMEVDTSETVPEGTVFTQVAAGDNATFAVTDDGLVYGWGTIRGTDGIIGFSPDSTIVKQPKLLPELKNVTKLVAGNNHFLALTSKGAVFAWGAGEHNQLGRRIVERTRNNALIPREFGLPKVIVDISAGAEHSFALHKNGKVYGWGFNAFSQTGHREGAGEPDSVTPVPTVVKSLAGHKIISMAGGNEHSIFITEKGECLVVGRTTNHATGLKVDTIPDDALVRDERGKPAIVTIPTRVPGFEAVFAAAGSDTSMAITKDGKVWSWGYNDAGQAGANNGDDDVRIAQLLDSPVIRDKKVVWVGLGAHFSVLGAVSR